MHLVHLAFVAKKSSTVREALQFLATFDGAFVGSIMLVHMFAGYSQYNSNVFMSWGKKTHLHSHFLSKNNPEHSLCLQIILPSWFFGGSSARL